MKSASNTITVTLASLMSLPITSFSGVKLPDRQLSLASKPTAPKLAPDLLALLAHDDQDDALRLPGKTLAEVRRARLQRKQAEVTTGRVRVNGLMLPSDEVAPEEKQSFVVQLSGSTPDVVWQETLARLNARVSQQINGLGLVTIEAPRTAMRQLAAADSIAYVSPDRPVQASGHLTVTTGAEQARRLAQSG